MDAPREDLVRAIFTGTAAVALRAARQDADEEDDATGAGGNTEGTAAELQRVMFGHFAVFNRWTEIDSYWEGNFMERLAPGCFKKTIAESRDSIKVLYDHGYDPQLGNKPLGPIDELREDQVGAYYEVPLIDTGYNRDFVIPAVDAGLLGTSFRFRVVKDEIDQDPGVSDYNPKGIPERTILEVRLFEFGPVTFPAYEEASAGLRSRADSQLWRALDDEGRAELARLIARANASGTPNDERAARGTRVVDDGAAAATTEEPVRHSTAAVTPALRRSRLLNLKDFHLS